MSFKTRFAEVIKAIVPTPPAPTEKPAAPPADSPGSWIMLTPGRHTVDGQPVEIPPSEQLLVPFPVKPGRRVVDGKIVIAPLIYQSR